MPSVEGDESLVVLLSESKSTFSPMCDEGLPTTIDAAEAKSAEEQEMTRTDVVATRDGPINVFYAICFTLE